MKLSLYSAVFAAALMCSSGYAQTTKAQAYVPFAFQVGETAMPAGNYSMEDARGILRMYLRGGPNGVFHLTMKASRSKVTPDSKLEFTRYGKECYLTSIWNGGSTEGRMLTVTKHQRELRQFRISETAHVALKAVSH